MVFSGRNLSLAARFNSYVEALPNPSRVRTGLTCPLPVMGWHSNLCVTDGTACVAIPRRAAKSRLWYSTVRTGSLFRAGSSCRWEALALAQAYFFRIISRSNAAGVTDDVVGPLQKVGLCQHRHVALGCSKPKMLKFVLQMISASVSFVFR